MKTQTLEQRIEKIEREKANMAKHRKNAIYLIILEIVLCFVVILISNISITITYASALSFARFVILMAAGNFIVFFVAYWHMVFSHEGFY